MAKKEGNKNISADELRGGSLRPESLDIRKTAAKCPECDAQLYVEFNEWETETGKPTYAGMDINCTAEDFDDPETIHRHWQCDWQPVIDKVWEYVQEHHDRIHARL